jgi:hypothetical protein
MLLSGGGIAAIDGAVSRQPSVTGYLGPEDRLSRGIPPRGTASNEQVSGEAQGHSLRGLWTRAGISRLSLARQAGGYAILLPALSAGGSAPDQAVGFRGLIRSIVGDNSHLLNYPTARNVTAGPLLKAASFTELRPMPRMVPGVDRPLAAAGRWSIIAQPCVIGSGLVPI